MLEELCLPKDVYDWAMAYLSDTLAKDHAGTQKEVVRLKRRISETQATLDAILLRAAQADDGLADGFMRLARQKQEEITVLEQRRNQIENGKQENTCDPIKILELAQNVSDQYVTFSPP